MIGQVGTNALSGVAIAGNCRRISRTVGLWTLAQHATVRKVYSVSGISVFSIVLSNRSEICEVQHIVCCCSTVWIGIGVGQIAVVASVSRVDYVVVDNSILVFNYVTECTTFLRFCKSVVRLLEVTDLVAAYVALIGFSSPGILVEVLMDYDTFESTGPVRELLT